jgi:glycosyltransferase A (GT-A) superfamily protein (DUF2064 family)
MQQDGTSTAILIFVRSQLEEVRSKKGYSGAGYQNDLKLTALLNRQVLSVAQASRLPVFIISGEDQVGHDFGERFTNAIQSVFQKGFQNVITLGNDCLGLQTGHLLQAHAQLQYSPLVIGPASDGGTYLIGLSQELFDADMLQQLPWQTASLLESFKAMASDKEVAIAWLREEKDLDSAFDLKAIIKALPFQNILNLLLLIIGFSRQELPELNYAYLSSPLLLSPQYRGPPTPLAISTS